VLVDPIVLLKGTWRQGVAGDRLAERLRCWAQLEPVLARFVGDPGRLFAFLRTPPSSLRDEVFCALLRCAKSDQLAGLVLLEALLPGLKAIFGRTLLRAAERDELLALLLAQSWQQLVGYPVERRPRRVAANLLLDIRKYTLRELERVRRESSLPLEGGETPDPADAGADVELPLRRAVAAGALSEAEAELILETRVDRRRLPEIAAELGVAYITVYQRRARAERRLLLFLGVPVKNRGSRRHMCSARTDAAGGTD
jgi:DNA-directed RNA polymerase specialized sigma24 family protein